MITDDIDTEARVQCYRRLRATTRAGSAVGKGLLDRYARALLQRAQTAREVAAVGVRRLERLCDLNEAGLLDYRGRGPAGPRYALSRAGAAVLAASAPPIVRRAADARFSA